MMTFLPQLASQGGRIACNRATADFIISSPLLEAEYRPAQKDFSAYAERSLPLADPPAPGTEPED